MSLQYDTDILLGMCLEKLQLATGVSAYARLMRWRNCGTSQCSYEQLNGQRKYGERKQWTFALCPGIIKLNHLQENGQNWKIIVLKGDSRKHCTFSLTLGSYKEKEGCATF